MNYSCSVGTFKALLFTCIYLLINSCSPVEITVEVEAGLESYWEELIEGVPAPEGLVFTFNARTEEPNLRLQSSLGQNGHVQRTLQPFLYILLDRTWLAPSGPSGDFNPSIPLASIPTDRLRPLNQIELPETARAVDGLYPDDPRYPLVREIWLAPSATNPKGNTLWEGWWNQVIAQGHRGNDPLLAAPVVYWIGAVGDMLPSRGIETLLTQENGTALVFQDLLPLLQSQDFLLGNLEGAVTIGGEPLKKTYTFRFLPQVLNPLAQAGFKYFSLVNNHSWDYGVEGFLDTLDNVKKAGIATSGVGRKASDAMKPYKTQLFKVGGAEQNLDISVLSVGAYPVERNGFDGAKETTVGETTPGVLWAEDRNPSGKALAFQAMKEGFTPQALNILMVHGGPEWSMQPPDDQRKLYREYIDAGANLVLGHHSHVVQGFEVYKGGIIAYSLGNFLFPGMDSTIYGQEGLLLSVGWSQGGIRYLRLWPASLGEGSVALDTENKLLIRLEAQTKSLDDNVIAPEFNTSGAGPSLEEGGSPGKGLIPTKL